MVRYLTAASAALLLCSGTLSGQLATVQEILKKNQPKSDETLTDYAQRVRTALEADNQAAQSATKGSAPPKKVAEEIDKKADEKTDDAVTTVANQPDAVGAPDGFGTRLGNSLTNFLPLFGISTDAVSTSDDDKSLTIDFNPVRVGIYGALKLSVTATEPEPNAKLVEGIVESVRSAQSEAMKKMLTDLDDITYSVTYGYQSSTNNPDWEADRARKMWGRHPKLYQGFVKAFMGLAWREALGTVPASGDVDETLFRALCANAETADLASGNLETLTFSMVEEAGVEKEQVASQIIEEEASWLQADRTLQALRLESLGDLVDNQPLATITAAWRDREALIGADTLSVSARIELGSWNVNRVLREARKLRDRSESDSPLLDAYREVVKNKKRMEAKNRFLFTANWKRRERHDVTWPYTESVTDPTSGAVSEFARSATLAVPESEELTVNVQWGRAIGRQSVMIDGKAVHPRLDVSLERIWADEDDVTRQDRWVTKLAYSLPVAKGLSLPLTLTYANRSEFLGEQDDVLSAHFGVSYGLSRLFSDKK